MRVYAFMLYVLYVGYVEYAFMRGCILSDPCMGVFVYARDIFSNPGQCVVRLICMRSNGIHSTHMATVYCVMFMGYGRVHFA